MARIVIIRHHGEPAGLYHFSIQLLVNQWRRNGHEVLVAKGLDALPDADAAVLHVNLSQVPEDYAAAAARYPIAINGRALDIRKRVVSRHLVTPGDGWAGPVVVKTDLNFAGWPEWRAAQHLDPAERTARKASEPLPTYRAFKRTADVPDEVWSAPHLVVEKFMPEADEHGFYVRSWFFFGDHEHCRRFVSPKWLVKGATMRDAGPCEVPDEIRAERRRLGSDWGKFDFLVHRGQPVLLDANKTPGTPPSDPMFVQLFTYLAGGLAPMLSDKAMAA